MTTLTTSQRATRIETGARCVTTIDFLHVEPADQDAALELAVDLASLTTTRAGVGQATANVLRSIDGSRVCTYAQWPNRAVWTAARSANEVERLTRRVRSIVSNDPRPRLYSVVYTDDRSPDGVSTISADFMGATFINEITTAPNTQRRLLELVIANNAAQSIGTTGYRSANFHKSADGQRAVNYSLWDTPQHCIDAISRMADMDENLEETVQIAEPDFRFYTLVHVAQPR